MRNLLKRFQPIDIIAIFVVVGGLILKFSGADGVVGTILTTVILFYFGKKTLVDSIIERKLPEAKAETVEQIIKRVALGEGVDPGLALRVAKCESGLNPAATNRNANGSLDRGLYQWNDKWHPEITDEIAFDVERATKAFCAAEKAGHLDWWNATRTCWAA